MPTHDMVVGGLGLAVLLLLCVSLYLRGRDPDRRSSTEKLERMVEQAEEEGKRAYRPADRGNSR